ncbi:hypothetical protein EVAR_32444_1 [Eumeta japonica]|uniref:Uncharacterized protein n=1 Tax=Eumeta variegata TaxID=151549 RepID=A0A4C1VLQ4_EUMVA|nr:hypothetical protein EVAR_32444_1 [Eumeta japonica]
MEHSGTGASAKGGIRAMLARCDIYKLICVLCADIASLVLSIYNHERSPIALRPLKIAVVVSPPRPASLHPFATPQPARFRPRP